MYLSAIYDSQAAMAGNRLDKTWEDVGNSERRCTLSTSTGQGDPPDGSRLTVRTTRPRATGAIFVSPSAIYVSLGAIYVSPGAIYVSLGAIYVSPGAIYLST